MRRVPAATWFRIAHIIEGSDTAVVILSSAPVARSARGKSIQLNAGSRTDVQWTGAHDRSRRLAGLRSEATIGAAHWAAASRITVETATVNAIPGAGDRPRVSAAR